MIVRSFRRLRQFISPSWLHEGDGGLVGYALDLIKDAFLERLRLGLMARFPQNDPTGATTAPSDALTATGRDRRVVRAIAAANETEAQYAARLLPWLDERKKAGSPYALMKALSDYLGAGVAIRTVDVRGNWYSRDADGTESALLKQANWDWDSGSRGDGLSRWSRFWVIIYPNGLWTEGTQAWGDPGTQAWGELGCTWGSTASPDEVATVRHIVADWKPEFAKCVNIIIAFDPLSFDPASPEPDGLWERWSKNVAGVQVPARLSTARYWDGV